MNSLMEVYQALWMLESHWHQRLAWQDAKEARIARLRAEEQAAAQMQAMLVANPGGRLGSARLDDPETLKESGLL